MYCPCLSDKVQAPVSPCKDCKVLQARESGGGISDDTACYHYTVLDDLKMKKIEESSRIIMKMINSVMRERLMSSIIKLPDVAYFDQGAMDFQSINYAPPVEI
jgi:hypothetical protein